MPICPLQHVENFQELHINCSLNICNLASYLDTIGILLDNGKYLIVTDDGNCWMVDPSKFSISFTEKDCAIDDKIKTLPFMPKHIKKIRIPNGITYITSWAFDNCINLEDAMIPDNVVSIGNAAFRGCKCLKSIEIPDSAISIGDSAFSCCYSLVDVKIGNNVTTIGGGAFFRCDSLTRINLPKNVQCIKNEVFWHCMNLEDVTFEGNIEEIGKRAFDGCLKLKNVVFKEKTLDEVGLMKDYPWRIKDESIIKVG